jgi:hypothetical protein
LKPIPPRRDLLRAQPDTRRHANAGLVSRLVRWLSKDARTMAHLDDELARVRFGHLHEMERLRALLDAGSLGAVAKALALDLEGPPQGPKDRPLPR